MSKRSRTFNHVGDYDPEAERRMQTKKRSKKQVPVPSLPEEAAMARCLITCDLWLEEILPRLECAESVQFAYVCKWFVPRWRQTVRFLDLQTLAPMTPGQLACFSRITRISGDGVRDALTPTLAAGLVNFRHLQTANLTSILATRSFFDQLANLTTLTLQWPRVLEADAFLGLPKLRSLTLELCQRGSHVTLPTVVSPIKGLALYAYDLQMNMSTYASYAPTLERLVLNCVVCTFDARHVFPVLRHLTVQRCKLVEFEAPLVSFPALRSMTVDAWICNDILPCRGIETLVLTNLRYVPTRYLDQAGPTLTDLTITNCGYVSPCYLAGLTALRHLELDSSYLGFDARNMPLSRYTYDFEGCHPNLLPLTRKYGSVLDSFSTRHGA